MTFNSFPPPSSIIFFVNNTFIVRIKFALDNLRCSSYILIDNDYHCQQGKLKCRDLTIGDIDLKAIELKKKSKEGVENAK